MDFNPRDNQGPAEGRERKGGEVREEGEIVCAQAKTSQTRLLPGCEIQTDSNRRWTLFGGVFRSRRERAAAARETEQKGVCCLLAGVGREERGCLYSCPGCLGVPLLLPIALSRWAGWFTSLGGDRAKGPARQSGCSSPGCETSPHARLPSGCPRAGELPGPGPGGLPRAAPG